METAQHRASASCWAQQPPGLGAVSRSAGPQVVCFGLIFGQGAMRVNGFFEARDGHVLLRYCGSVHNEQTQRSTGHQLAAGSSGCRGSGGRYAILAPLVSQVNNAPIAPPLWVWHLKVQRRWYLGLLASISTTFQAMGSYSHGAEVKEKAR